MHLTTWEYHAHKKAAYGDTLPFCEELSSGYLTFQIDILN